MKSDEVLWPDCSTFDVAHDTSFCPDHQTKVDTYTPTFMAALQSMCIIMVIGTRAHAITNLLYECWVIYHHYNNHLGRWQPLVEQLALIDVWHCQYIIPQYHNTRGNVSILYHCWHCSMLMLDGFIQQGPVRRNLLAVELDSHRSSFFLITFFSEWQFNLLSRGENDST